MWSACISSHKTANKGEFKEPAFTNFTTFTASCSTDEVLVRGHVIPSLTVNDTTDKVRVGTNSLYFSLKPFLCPVEAVACSVKFA
jgi:hypothetical protein